jgi:dolichol-phosphate mannosyltransferase
VNYCRGDYIIILDSDLTYRPSSIRDMLDCLKGHPTVDCISSSPYQYPHIIPISKSYFRHFGSVTFNKIYSIIIGHHITCATSMFRLYKSEVIRNMNLKSVGFDVNAEILFDLIIDKKEIIEISVTLYDRDYGVSKMNVLNEFYRAVRLIFKIIKKRALNK